MERLSLPSKYLSVILFIKTCDSVIRLSVDFFSRCTMFCSRLDSVVRHLSEVAQSALKRPRTVLEAIEKAV